MITIRKLVSVHKSSLVPGEPQFNLCDEAVMVRQYVCLRIESTFNWGFKVIRDALFFFYFAFWLLLRSTILSTNQMANWTSCIVSFLVSLLILQLYYIILVSIFILYYTSFYIVIISEWGPQVY